MKGFQQKTSGDGIFFVIKHNSIVRESKTPQEGFESIVTKNPRSGEDVTKYIQRFDSLEALVTKIEWYDTEQRYETRYMGWKIHLDANGKHGVLDLPFNSRVSSRFMKLAENIDFTKPVEFRAWKDNKTDSTAFLVAQEEKSIPQKYTRENPGACPEPVQGFNGKWNYDKQMEFLHSRMTDVVIPKVLALNPAKEKEEPANCNGHEPETETPPASSVLKSIKATIKALAGSDEAQGATKAELMENYFGTAVWSEIEKMPEDVLVAGRNKLDDLLPF